MEYQIRRLEKRIAKIPGYVIKRCLKKKEPLVLIFKGNQMTVTVDKLKILSGGLLDFRHWIDMHFESQKKVDK
jgi:hypothetical protein